MADVRACEGGSTLLSSIRRCCTSLPTTCCPGVQLRGSDVYDRRFSVKRRERRNKRIINSRSRKGGGSAFRNVGAQSALRISCAYSRSVWVTTVIRSSPWAASCTSRGAHQYTTYWPPERQDSQATTAETRSARETRVDRRWRAIGPVARSDHFQEGRRGTYLTPNPNRKTSDGACTRHLQLRYHDRQKEQVPNKVLSHLDQLTSTECQGRTYLRCADLVERDKHHCLDKPRKRDRRRRARQDESTPYRQGELRQERCERMSYHFIHG